MAEYIERNSALKIMHDTWAINNDANDAMQESIDLICKLPAADVRPVVRGKWIVKTDADGKTYGVCSECGYEQYAGHLKFCPNCGADMREES